MEHLAQGLCRTEKKKRKAQIALSKIIALAQCSFALLGLCSLIILAVYFLLSSNNSVAVSGLAQGQQTVIANPEKNREMLLKVDHSLISSRKNSADKVIPQSHIVVNLPSRTLDYYNNNQLVKTYSVAIGKPSTPTPLGSFLINQKEVNPWWYPPRRKTVVPSGPNNPLGYRWLGFAPLYGIHGTNTPWEVGGSVSNGCVRMFEEDVEELFELVTYGTGVNITYDRVRVETSKTGQVSLGIYPDVYHYKKQKITLAEVQEKMTAAGLQGIMSESLLQQSIDKPTGQQVLVAQIHKLKVNGTLLSVQAIASDGRIMVPVWPVAAALGIDAAWDKDKQVMIVDNRSAQGKIQGDRLYLFMEDIQGLFGGMWLWQQENNCWELVIPQVGQK